MDIFSLIGLSIAGALGALAALVSISYSHALKNPGLWRAHGILLSGIVLWGLLVLAGIIELLWGYRVTPAMVAGLVLVMAAPAIGAAAGARAASIRERSESPRGSSEQPARRIG